MQLDRVKSEAVLAEFIGTFGLTLAVLVSLTTSGFSMIPTGVIAGLVLGLFVLVIGTISGSHINPAVTIGQYTIGKINAINAVSYIVAQISGALLALVVLSLFNDGNIFELGSKADWKSFWAELLGALVFGFAIAGAIYNKLNPIESAFAVGGGLTFGILLASVGSNGVLNPAVALGIGSSSWPYIVGPVVGVILGMNVYRLLLPPAKTATKSSKK